MKKIVSTLVALVFALAAFGQTAEEIVTRMDEAMKSRDSESMAMTLEIKIPILGTLSTRAYIFGEKLKMEMEVAGVQSITWIDGDVERTYDSSEKTITIKRHDTTKRSEAESNAEMLEGITEGYDVSLTRETADAWYIRCKKSRTNLKKDDPKTMDLVVAKGSYYPRSLSTRVSGVSVTMRDMVFDVTESQVTFNPADYPGVTVKDER